MPAEPLPLLLLPGLLCDAALWTHQAHHLGRDRTVTVADLRHDDSLDAMAARVLAAAPPRFALAALSMGGYVAFAMLRAARERIARLALLDTSARADTDEQRTRRRVLLDLSRRGQFKGVTPRLLPYYLHPDCLAAPEPGGTVMAMAERLGPEVFLRQQHAIMHRPDSRDLLRGIATPTLVICGREDAATPLEHSEEIAALIPGARLAVIEECGHLSPLERPQAVTALLRLWLEGALP
ncbi:alpha/beta fold hydrolase [Elioraea tepidiphila]|jgi:pimeloyl-ACP methyl ester carboxylesterase|uniref:alpha/beta fold hydrolase n=1 Tax=Elioraea tepidiphila TaxID=457934 RepID=UPI00037B95DC|nr:alpha/beta fold hydrolase [Elioraea tepidiphila]